MYAYLDISLVVVHTALSRYLVQDLNSPFRHFLVLGYRTT